MLLHKFYRDCKAQRAHYRQTLLEPADCRVVVMRLKERLELHPHIHSDFEQLIIVRRGGGTMMVEDRHYSFRKPTILIVPALTAHSFAYEEGSDGWVVTVARDYFQEIMTRAPVLSEIFTVGNCIEYLQGERAFAEIERVVTKLHWERRRSARCSEIASEALLIDLLVAVLRKAQHSRFFHVAENGSHQEAYRKFVTIVEEHYKENWSLQKFADALSMSEPRLRTVCRSVSGQSPIRIINTRIILEAKRCLTYTSMSVSELAYRLGFEDPSYFSRFFRSRCGQTPTEYKMARKGMPQHPEQDKFGDGTESTKRRSSS